MIDIICNKMNNILPKLTMALSSFRKIVALWSTGYMIDCKLTGDGNLGAQCVNQVKVFPLLTLQNYSISSSMELTLQSFCSTCELDLI